MDWKRSAGRSASARVTASSTCALMLALSVRGRNIGESSATRSTAVGGTMLVSNSYSVAPIP